MYGEDIDLSWRIIKGGWENHYFADTQIIHYKGESTKKGSLNYVSVFYKAMLIFSAKHFEGGQATFYNWIIRLAIYTRASLSVVRRLSSRLFLPVVEGAVLYSSLIFIFYSFSFFLYPTPTRRTCQANSFSFIKNHHVPRLRHLFAFLVKLCMTYATLFGNVQKHTRLCF